MSAFMNHFAFQFRTGIRNKSLLLLHYLFPLGFYLLMGLIMTQINPLFVETMIPAMVIFAILAATLLGLPDPLVTDREAGIFRSYRINGVPAISILAVPALSAMVHIALVSTIIVISGRLLFEAPLPVSWPGFVLAAIIAAFACAGIGVLIGVVSPSSQITVLWSQLVFLPSMLLSGLTGMPLSLLPGAVGRIALLLPPTHAMHAFRGLAMELPTEFDPTLSLMILLSSGLLAFGLAIYLFNWDRRNTTPRGHPLMALLVLLPYVAALLWQ